MGEVEVGEKGVLSVGGGLGYANTATGATGPLTFTTAPLLGSGNTAGGGGKGAGSALGGKGNTRGGSIRFNNRRGVPIWSVEYVHIPSIFSVYSNSILGVD